MFSLPFFNSDLISIVHFMSFHKWVNDNSEFNLLSKRLVVLMLRSSYIRYCAVHNVTHKIMYPMVLLLKFEFFCHGCPIVHDPLKIGFLIWILQISSNVHIFLSRTALFGSTTTVRYFWLNQPTLLINLSIRFEHSGPLLN